jgi:hypothetical protein
MGSRMGVQHIDQLRHALLHPIAQGAQWVGEDEYPSQVAWADEAERRLQFVRARGGLDAEYISRLRGPARQRGDALAEITAAYFFGDRCGLPILQWRAAGAGGKTGEFLIGLRPTGQAFVEVKRPSWRAEVARTESQESARLEQPKHIHGETRATVPWQGVRDAVRRAHPQFPDAMPTLLVLHDDLFLPLNLQVGGPLNYHSPRFALYSDAGCFTGAQYERLGAVATLNEDTPGDFSFALFRNPHALGSAALPPGVFADYPSFRGWSGWS